MGRRRPPRELGFGDSQAVASGPGLEEVNGESAGSEARRSSRGTNEGEEPQAAELSSFRARRPPRRAASVRRVRRPRPRTQERRAHKPRPCAGAPRPQLAAPSHVRARRSAAPSSDSGREERNGESGFGESAR
jgi:hypothetical protein